MKTITRMGWAAMGIVAFGSQAAVLDLTPGTPLINSDNGHQYKVFYAPVISWADAQAYVQANLPGWYLATATSEAENIWIWGAVQGAWSANGGSFPPGQYWLGGFMPSADPPHAWAWVTGEPWSYTNWGSAEPNGDVNWTGHLTIGRFNDQSWNDEGGWPDGITGFVAEVPEPGAYAAMFGLAGLAWAGYRRARK